MAARYNVYIDAHNDLPNLFLIPQISLIDSCHSNHSCLLHCSVKYVGGLLLFLQNPGGEISFKTVIVKFFQGCLIITWIISEIIYS